MNLIEFRNLRLFIKINSCRALWRYNTFSKQRGSTRIKWSVWWPFMTHALNWNMLFFVRRWDNYKKQIFKNSIKADYSNAIENCSQLLNLSNRLSFRLVLDLVMRQFCRFKASLAWVCLLYQCFQWNFLRFLLILTSR